jgi:hypothetical protein
MRGADQDRLLGNAAPLVDRATDLLDRLTADEQRVESNDGHAVLPIVPDGSSHLARIVQNAMKRLAVSARLFHANLGRDVTLGKSDLERHGLSRLDIGIHDDGHRRHGENQADQTNDARHGVASGSSIGKQY